MMTNQTDLRTALKRVDVRAEADGYEFRADEGDYTPTEHERAMLEDFGNGLITRVEEELAPKPTGTEAGRGAGRKNWKLAADLSRPLSEWDAATPEPPTPPTPDSTAQGDGLHWRQVERAWRDSGLPGYFLGNGGSNDGLYAFVRLVRSLPPVPADREGGRNV